MLDPRIFVAFLAQFVGGDYGFCDRCGGTCYDRTHDCSGLQCHGTNATGLTRGVCTSSFVIATECWNLGLYMSQAEAEADSGPDVFWAFHGANFGRTDDGSRPNGASGHIVLVVRVRRPDGTTERFYTIEAMGHRYGIVFGTYSGRYPGWSGRYRIPGVADRPPVAASSTRSERMAVQQPRKKPVGGAIAYADLSADGTHVECWNGCSIDGDGKHPTIANLRIWRPNDSNAAAKFTRFGEYAPKHRDDDPATPANEAYDGPLGIFVADDRGGSWIGLFS